MTYVLVTHVTIFTTVTIVTTVTHITFVNTVTAITAVTTSVLSWEGLQLAGVEGSSLGPAQAMEEQMVVAIFEVC